jgi:endonuclease/exonuclease/phosphatase family metal-dependent hydrolase
MGKEIKTLTYNLSWASQKNVLMGSEEDFVRKCQTINRNCYEEALKKIKELHQIYKFGVIGIQEVEHKDLVTAICNNTKLKGWYRGATWNSHVGVYSGCAIIWNTKTLGTMKTAKTINLATPDKANKCDARTCCIVTTSKDINLVVAHFPWLNNNYDVKKISKIIDAHISSNGPIIILADTNDEKTLISSENPLIIKNKKLSHGLTKDAAQTHLQSCCWHENGHEYKHLRSTGDYILSEKVRNIHIPLAKPENTTTETELYSDHMPVIATVVLYERPNTPITSAPKNRTRKSGLANFLKSINLTRRRMTSSISGNTERIFSRTRSRLSSFTSKRKTTPTPIFIYHQGSTAQGSTAQGSTAQGSTAQGSTSNHI